MKNLEKTKYIGILFFLLCFILFFYDAPDKKFINNLDCQIKNQKLFYYGYVKKINDNTNDSLTKNKENIINNYKNENELFYEIKTFEDINKTVDTYNQMFGGINPNLKKIDSLKIQNCYFYHTYQLYNFKHLFDKDNNGLYWGINKNSKDILSQNIKINYYKNNKNYSISIYDLNDNEIVFMKKNNFKNFKEAYAYYDKNKNNINDFISGIDSLIIKNIKIKKYDKTKTYNLKNFYISCDINLNGFGEDLLSENKLSLNDSYKFDFRHDTIIYIKNKYENNPYMAYYYK